MSNEHGNCQSCGADLNGELIWDYFYNLSGDEQHADRVADNYGATRTSGRWGRAIAMYDFDKDKTVAFKCPNCGYKWERK